MPRSGLERLLWATLIVLMGAITVGNLVARFGGSNEEGRRDGSEPRAAAPALPNERRSSLAPVRLDPEAWVPPATLEGFEDWKLGGDEDTHKTTESPTLPRLCTLRQGSLYCSEGPSSLLQRQTFEEALERFQREMWLTPRPSPLRIR